MAKALTLAYDRGPWTTALNPPCFPKGEKMRGTSESHVYRVSLARTRYDVRSLLQKLVDKGRQRDMTVVLIRPDEKGLVRGNGRLLAALVFLGNQHTDNKDDDGHDRHGLSFSCAFSFGVLYNVLHGQPLAGLDDMDCIFRRLTTLHTQLPCNYTYLYDLTSYSG
ncbi:hypothetical protein ACRALDRAFT_205118 [Sodiomyces alcalophilus JCM 7366]|uniref:uncharacterized protein n=1 Tax=Sodiomyces alcalophilus JCM 7366 TaxID=591952 RepID=UPI0039B3FB15